jgi:hypothetical protein
MNKSCAIPMPRNHQAEQNKMSQCPWRYVVSIFVFGKNPQLSSHYWKNTGVTPFDLSDLYLTFLAHFLRLDDFRKPEQESFTYAKTASKGKF